MKKKIVILIILLSVSSIVFGVFFSKNTTPDEIDYWVYKHLNYKELHHYSTGSSQTIAIIDSGISSNIKLDAEKAFSLTSEDIYDYNGHGTMMYSIIKGTEDDILGISPDVDILSIKILDKAESTRPELIYDAIEMAIDKNATVINLSVGSYKNNEDIAGLIKEAHSKNITVTASSGDFSNFEMMFPANMREVISIGALGENLQPLELTSGPDLTTINAPGENILVLDANDEIFYSSGTSQATALISGYIALLRDYALKNNIFLSNEDIGYYLSLIKEGNMQYSDVFNELSMTEA
ncbi:serine protease [Halolactibacillus miurensis]|uniref:Serine protease n=1 Tax=Halolactibacillus miurensis TaxID=306541 RepID=A0A1I6V4E0_9BACI|nr:MULTISPECIES: S8 family serine peptidase [Halolactibacillus]GEM05977.1 serine protease [Halolactibacillus miurensis]SFT08565.1 Subtilase family protein [Halolactibacillus miurensis]